MGRKQANGVIDRAHYLSQVEAQRLITVTQARAIMDLAKGRVSGVVAWAVIDLALQTGLRVSELASIRHGDIDFKRSSLHALRLKRRKPVKETIALSKALVEHLREYVQWKEAVGQPTGKADALLIGKRGPMTARGLQQAWKAAVKRAGLPESLSIHSARHTLAVALLAKTGNLRMVQKQLGHASPTTTANLYADVPFEAMQAGLEGVYGNGGEAGQA